METATELGYQVLAQRSDALQVIFESLPMGVVIADDQGRILFANPAAYKILGIRVSSDYCAGSQPISGWYLPDQLTLLSPEQLPLTRAICGEQILDEVVFLRDSQIDGGAWIRVNAWPLKDADGVVSGGVMMFHDFTQGRGAGQMLLLLAQAVEQTADSVLLTDTEGVIQYVNPAFELTTGYSKEEALGKTTRILKSGLHDAEFYRQLWARLREGSSSRGMIINRKKSGELYWGQQTITPMRDESGRQSHFVAVLQDITEARKKQEQEFQLQLAREVQQRFYGPAPVVCGFDIGAAAHPAYETGGDYFDFIEMEDGCLLIAVGDVNGHGFGSALIMALTRAYVRSFAAMQLEPDEILRQVNRALLRDLKHGQYVTLSLARMDSRNRTFWYASAGHVPGFVFGESGEVKCALESTGPPLGLFADSRSSLQPAIPVTPGEVVVMLTDGITESATPQGDLFGIQRVHEFISAHRHEPAQQIADDLYRAARAFASNDPQSDDLTSVVIKADRHR